MTTLYDHPVKPTDSDQDDYELADYDLDVVDDALLNPENSEFLDHFGFKIQVRTDDESSSDDDSDFEAEDNNKTKHNTTAKEPEEEDLVPPTRQSLSATEKSNISSSDDDYSVDTHITTPPAQHKPWPLTVDTTAIENNTSRLSQETTSTSTTSKSNNRASVLSFTGFSNPFKRPQSTATLSSPVIIPRPSQSFHQRQSKRYSETPPIGTPRSPASTQKSFNLLVSKFRRFSHNDHKYDSAKHTALKQEALQELIETKEAMPEINVDWDFWVLLISDFGRVIETQIDDLRHHLTQGLPPPPVHGLLWQIISKSRDSFDMEFEYGELIKRSSPYEKQITKDLNRTFPDHPFFMQEQGRRALFNVAKAYSLFDQEVGFCQGLAFIIGCLLLHMEEEDAFCVLIKLMGKYGLRGHFTPQMDALHQQMYQFDNVLQQKLPVVHRHMEQEGVTPSMYASQWFITLFAYRCPVELCFRVLDLLLVEGTQVLVQIAVAIITRNQETILKLSFEQLVEFLTNGVFDVFEGNENDFVEDVYRVDLPARFMARLAKQYSGESARESRSTSQEDHLRRVNGQLSEHLRRVESSLNTLEKEHHEMTKQTVDTKMQMARTEDEKEQLKHELAQLKADFEKHQREIHYYYQSQLQNASSENKQLHDQNNQLSAQLTETETMLINMKINFAERESEFDRHRLKQ